MKRSRFSEQRIIAILREEARSSTADVCRKYAVSSATVYKWKANYGGMGVSQVCKLKTPHDENARLAWLLGDAMLGNAALKEPAYKYC